MKRLTLQAADKLGAKRFNYAIYRVLLRMLYSKDGEFAVFVRDRAVHFMNAASDDFARMTTKENRDLVGVYNWNSDVEQIVADLKLHFEDPGLPESNLHV